MSIGAVLTLGYGSFGSVNLVPTLGFGSGSTPPVPPDDLVLLGGGPGYSYSYPHIKHQEEKLARELAEAERHREELHAQKLEAEQKQKDATLKALAKAEAEELAQLEAQAQEEISRILLLRAELVRRIRDEEEALILLLTLPFVN